MRKAIVKIIYLQSLIAVYALKTPSGFDKLTPEQLAADYNGAGPDWMKKWMRKCLTWLLDKFEAAFLIHDVQFTYSDRTKKGFNNANNLLWQNIKAIINYDYPLYNPLCWKDRAEWYFKGWSAYRGCKRFGWSAWIDGKPQK